MKNLQFCKSLKNHQLYQNWKIFNFDHILKFWVFPFEKSSNLNKSHKNHIASMLSKFEKTSNFYHNLKNLQIWSYFEKSSFFAKIWKIFIWTNFDKSSHSILIKFWKIINFYQYLNNHQFLPKFENLQFLQKSSIFSKIWKIINFCQNLKIFNLVRSLKKFSNLTKILLK